MKQAKLPTLKIDRNALKRLDIFSLSRLQDALHTLADVANGLNAQPCFWSEEADEATDAGDLLETLTTFLDYYTAEVVATISDATPENPSEAIEMVWARVRHEAALGNNIADFARMVSGLTACLGKVIK